MSQRTETARSGSGSFQTLRTYGGSGSGFSKLLQSWVPAKESLTASPAQAAHVKWRRPDNALAEKHFHTWVTPETYVIKILLFNTPLLLNRSMNCSAFKTLLLFECLKAPELLGERFILSQFTHSRTLFFQPLSSGAGSWSQTKFSPISCNAPQLKLRVTTGSDRNNGPVL